MSYFQTWVDYRNLKSLHRQIEKRGCLNTSGLGPPQIFEYINKTYGCTYIYDMCIYDYICTYIYINLFIHFHYSSLNHIPLQTLAALTHRTSHHVHQHFPNCLATRPLVFPLIVPYCETFMDASQLCSRFIKTKTGTSQRKRCIPKFQRFEV